MSDSPKRSIISIDNFWNILTWVAIPLSVEISSEYGSILGLIGSFTLVPYILAKFNNIYFDPSSKEDTPLAEVKVFNKRGESLSMHLPFEFDYVKSCFIVSIIMMVIIGNVFTPSEIDTSLIIFALLGLPMSYFIKNNIPVSAFFNSKAWDYYEVWYTPNDKKISHTTASGPSKSPSSSLDNYYSPKKHYLSSNIYNHKRR